MTTFDIGLNLFLGFLALSLLSAVAKLIHAKQNYRLAILYALMSLSILTGIILDVIQAYFLSDTSETYLEFIQWLDTIVFGFFLGLLPSLFLFVKFNKSKKLQQGNREVREKAGKKG